MLWRSWLRRAALSVAWFLLSLSLPSVGHAGPVIAFGGGVAAGGLLDLRNDPWTPMGWLSVGGDLGDSWSGFARVGYQRHDAPLDLAVCTGTDCPRISSAERRATYLPLSVGLRLSAPRPAFSRTRVYVEAASSIAWANYEEEVELIYSAGGMVRDVRSSEHWLPGVEVGAGFSQRLARGLGLEWGLRYAYRATPQLTLATSGLDTERDGFSQVTLVAALTMGP